jgi:orotate phosphoribosyltransferase-like protein
MASAAANGRRAGRREVTNDHEKVKRAHELKARGLQPEDIGKIIGVSGPLSTATWLWIPEPQR